MSYCVRVQNGDVKQDTLRYITNKKEKIRGKMQNSKIHSMGSKRYRVERVERGKKIKNKKLSVNMQSLYGHYMNVAK